MQQKAETHLKYKNIAFILAVTLLIVIIFVTALTQKGGTQNSDISSAVAYSQADESSNT